MSFDNLNKNHEGKKANIFLLIFLTVLSYGMFFIGMLLPFIASHRSGNGGSTYHAFDLNGKKRDGIICAVAGSCFFFL
jgi:hypothetical protein